VKTVQSTGITSLVVLGQEVPSLFPTIYMRLLHFSFCSLMYSFAILTSDVGNTDHTYSLPIHIAHDVFTI